MADDDFLMGDDLFGSDFEDLISKDDLITSEGLNYFLGVDDQVNAMIPPGGVSDTESINSLTSQGLMNGSFNDMIRREKTRKKKTKKGLIDARHAALNPDKVYDFWMLPYGQDRSDPLGPLRGAVGWHARRPC